MNDFLHLLLTPRWLKRRVDRVEFLDLSTVHRTIVLTLDLGALAEFFPRRSAMVPLGWVLSGARAGTTVLDADGRVLPHVSREESREFVFAAIKERLERLERFDLDAKLATVKNHRGSDCDLLADGGKFDGCAALAADKWGCPAVAEILEALRIADPSEPPREEVSEIVEVLLAWQSNYVLFLRCGKDDPPPSWGTLTVAYDERLQEWLPPWERRFTVLGRDDLTRAAGRDRRREISRGGPFDRDLDALFPRGVRGYLARSKRLPVRRLGRRGVLRLAWHVAWLEASGLDVQSHHVEVVLPRELTVVRMRMVRQTSRERIATTAYEIGSRAAIEDPRPRQSGADRARAIPSLFSLVVTQDSSGSWYAGAFIALLTAVAVLVAALAWRGQIITNSADTVTVLVVAPTLISALLFVQSGSEIAGQLIQTLRALIALIGVLAVVAALELVFTSNHPTALRLLWIVDGALLVLITVVLSLGGWRLSRHRRFAALSAAGDPAPLHDVAVGEALLPPGQPPPPDQRLVSPPRIPPPDCWIASGEGDRVPWGWLSGRARNAVTGNGRLDGEDKRYWYSAVLPGDGRKELLRWVASIFQWLLSTTTSVASSANPSVLGQEVTFTATVNTMSRGAGTPTGTLQFLDGDSPIGTRTLSDGVAKLTTANLAVGSHPISTRYEGDVNFKRSAGSLTGTPQVVKKADTTTSATS